VILIGQYISPFVRRVGIALTLHGIGFEHRPWSTFGDADKIRPYSPVLRVPVLVLDDGSTVIESDYILDLVDTMASQGTSVASPMAADRQHGRKITALGKVVAEKAVSLVYEKRLHPDPSRFWAERCVAQIAEGLAALEANRAARPGKFWSGTGVGHPDIMVAVAYRFVRDAHADCVTLSAFPALAAHSEQMEAMPAFQATQHAVMKPSMEFERHT
jgi:glutathione S-transferase